MCHQRRARWKPLSFILNGYARRGREIVPVRLNDYVITLLEWTTVTFCLFFPVTPCLYSFSLCLARSSSADFCICVWETNLLSLRETELILPPLSCILACRFRTAHFSILSFHLSPCRREVETTTSRLPPRSQPICKSRSRVDTLTNISLFYSKLLFVWSCLDWDRLLSSFTVWLQILFSTRREKCIFMQDKKKWAGK